VIGERLLTGYVDAQALARQLGKAFATSKVKIATPFQYTGTKDRALFAGVIAADKHTLLSVNLVLPELWHYSLGLAFGFSSTATEASGKVLARSEGSLASNDDAGVSAAQRWQHFGSGSVSLDYPAGWLGNFTGAGPAWFVGPDTRGMLFAVGQAYTGDASAATLSAAGRLVEQNIAGGLHKGLKVVSEQASDGVFRWVGTYPGPDGTSQNVEVGQVAMGKGTVTIVWGDSSSDQLPANLPLFGHSLDTAARAAGATPPAPTTVTSLLQALRQNTPVDPSPGTSSSTSTDLGPPALDQSTSAMLSEQARLDRSQEAFLTLSNLETERHEAFMSMMGYTYHYVPISW
jgi:hypothetical protein